MNKETAEKIQALVNKEVAHRAALRALYRANNESRQIDYDLRNKLIKQGRKLVGYVEGLKAALDIGGYAYSEKNETITKVWKTK